MALHLLTIISLLAAKPPVYQEIAPWHYRSLNKALMGKHVRVREIVGKVGARAWNPLLSARGLERSKWLRITPRKGWSHAVYLVSVHNHAAANVAHRLMPEDKCTMYGKVIGTARRLTGAAYVVVTKIERGWPDAGGRPQQNAASPLRRSR